MSMRHQAGIVLPGYNALKVANAPTIGTATVASGTSVSVAFTAPACVGGGAISSFTAFANCGLYTASGASSPLTVTGLTTGTTYTFKVIATNVFGPSYPSAASNSATPAVIGQDAYITAGTYSWVAPAGVTSVSVVAVGGGASASGANSYGAGGGALAYKNNATVVPGNSYTVVVGAGGPPTGTNGCNSTFTAGFGTMTAGGGQNPSGSAAGGTPSGTYDGGGNGGAGGYTVASFNYAGGGGAGGYGGAGGAGGSTNVSSAPTAGSNGGGGGGGGLGPGVAGNASGGGGVGILGQGSNGTAGTNSTGTPIGGGGGSAGSAGANGSTSYAAGSGVGGAYGGGGGATGNSTSQGGVGAVRIIYPGNTRSFPSTCTGNL